MLSTLLTQYIETDLARKQAAREDQAKRISREIEKLYADWLKTKEVSDYRNFLSALAQILNENIEEMSGEVIISSWKRDEKLINIILNMANNHRYYNTFLDVINLNNKSFILSPNIKWIESNFVQKFLEEEGTELKKAAVLSVMLAANDTSDFQVECELA